MKGDGYPKDSSLTEKQDRWLRDTNGGVTQKQQATLTDDERKSELSKSQKQAGHIPADKPFVGSW
jgi:hypothetical protein